jgi:S-adenosylmethionine:tRNA ribosyltransferase-isomerase
MHLFDKKNITKHYCPTKLYSHFLYLCKKKLKVLDFDYHLPEEKIAIYPLSNRSLSKLLIYDGTSINSDVFFNLETHIPLQSLLIRNHSKVYKARMYFNRQSGAKMEFFCLRWEQTKKGEATANCLIKNSKKLNINETLTCESNFNEQLLILQAQYLSKTNESCMVRFSWTNGDIDFEEILQIFGNAPLPPYIKREVESQDHSRYQTIYAKEIGSVAAPTAGLHFTTQLEDKLKIKNIQFAELVLHVGLGTFQPMKNNNFEQHQMHSEIFSVSKKTLLALYNQNDNPIVAVGTTSLRTLESLYLLAHRIHLQSPQTFSVVNQSEPLLVDKFLHTKSAWENILNHMEKNKLDTLSGSTSLMITPDYHCQSVDMIITNFHQPSSTLLLIVASMIGDNWKRVYDYALANEFRFLSYGDACLLKNMRKKSK